MAGKKDQKDSTVNASQGTATAGQGTATTGQGTAADGSAGGTAGGSAGTTAGGGDGGNKANAATPQPPKFPTTGKMVMATRADFGVDTTVRSQANLTFAALLPSYDYIMTNNYIRSELGQTDTVNGQGGGIAGGLANAMAPGAATIIDVKGKKSYTVANYLGILPAAIEEDITNYQDVFGLVAYFKKYMHQPDIKLTAGEHTTFKGYSANVVDMVVPVTPVVDENGRQSDALLFLHGLISGSGDMTTKHYDPSYKLYLETYYSHDLDGKVPAAITADKNVLHVDGFYIGSILKDEKGNKVVYAIRKVVTNVPVDEGQFLIPDGYEKMTHAKFHEKLREKLRMAN